MPVLTGIQMASRLKKDGILDAFLAKPVMVLLSGERFAQDSEVYELFDYVLMKPLILA